MPLCTPPRFRILVANLAGGSDPSRGTAGNPVKNRTGFDLQQMILDDGTTRINGTTLQPPAVSVANYTASITVGNPAYWDPAVAPPGPFYYQEQVSVLDQTFLAATDFGQGHGSAAGPVANIATELAASINATMSQVTAISNGGIVYIRDARQAPLFPIQATIDMMTAAGGGLVTWTIQDTAGTTLSAAGIRRRTFYLPKPVKSQNPPTILP